MVNEPTGAKACQNNHKQLPAIGQLRLRSNLARAVAQRGLLSVALARAAVMLLEGGLLLDGRLLDAVLAQQRHPTRREHWHLAEVRLSEESLRERGKGCTGSSLSQTAPRPSYQISPVGPPARIRTCRCRL